MMKRKFIEDFTCGNLIQKNHKNYENVICDKFQVLIYIRQKFCLNIQRAIKSINR
jgi:hypothetical protein